MQIEEKKEEESCASQTERRGFKQKFIDLEKRYSGLFRAGKFGIAGAIGFLVAEAIITFGVLVLYGNVNVPGAAYSSLTLLELNIIAFAIGVTVGFFVNERITVRNQGEQGSKKRNRNVIVRLLKFQGVYAAGNAVTIGVQLALLAAISLSPVAGNIVGAVVAFPLSYFISMRYVWKISAVASATATDRGAKERAPEFVTANFKNNSASAIMGTTPLDHNSLVTGEGRIVQDKIKSLSNHFIASIRNRTVIVEEYKFEARKLESAEGIDINFILKMRVSNNERMLKR
ncbi:MAG: GtrA family protein [archaeon]|nr:GtrA family protein [archaeon]